MHWNVACMSLLQIPRPSSSKNKDYRDRVTWQLISMACCLVLANCQCCLLTADHEASWFSGQGSWQNPKPDTLPRQEANRRAMFTEVQGELFRNFFTAYRLISLAKAGGQIRCVCEKQLSRHLVADCANCHDNQHAVHFQIATSSKKIVAASKVQCMYLHCVIICVCTYIM